MIKQYFKIAMVFVVFFILFIFLGVNMRPDTTYEFIHQAELDPLVDDQNHSTIEADTVPISMNQEANTIDFMIQEMSLSEKNGQLIMVGLDGEEADDQVATFIQDRHVGGVILTGANINNV